MCTPASLTLFQGLYPSIIIVLVALKKTHCDRNFNHGPDAPSSVQFASVSNKSAAFSISRLEEGNDRGITHRLEQSKPSVQHELSGGVEKRGVYLSSLSDEKEDDSSSVTFTDSEDDSYAKHRSRESYDI